MENVTFVQSKDVGLELRVGKKIGVEVLLKVRGNIKEFFEHLSELQKTLPTSLVVLVQKLQNLEVKKDAESGTD